MLCFVREPVDTRARNTVRPTYVRALSPQQRVVFPHLLGKVARVSDLTSIPPVAFELSDVEVVPAYVACAKQWQLYLGVFGANVALNLIAAVLAAGVVRPSHVNPVLVWGHLVTAALLAASVFVFWRGTKPRKQRASTISFDDTGMHLVANVGFARAVPWRAIRSVYDTGR